MRTPEEIDGYIARKTREGSVPGNVASGLALPVAFVLDRMDAMGLAYEAPNTRNKYHVDPMWDLSEDQLREAIWKRQHEGATAALRGAA